MGQEIHIACGGPSATGLIKDRPLITVNRDGFRYPNADYFITCDISFMKHNFTQINKEIKSQRIFVNDATNGRYEMLHLTNFCMFINCHGREGFGRRWDEFNTGCNSGFTAVQFAILMGYTRIHVYGIDLVYKDNKSHWHDGYGHERKFNEGRLDVFYNKFKNALNTLDDDIQLISHSDISRLNGLPHVTRA